MDAAEKIVDVGKKIQDIHEMTSSEYDLLSEQDKKLYLDAILPVKRAEAAKRKARYLERMMERKKKKVSYFSAGSHLVFFIFRKTIAKFSILFKVLSSRRFVDALRIRRHRK